MDGSLHSNAGHLCSLADWSRGRGQCTNTMGTTAQLQQLETQTIALPILSLG